MLGYKATAEATISQNGRLRAALRDVADLHRASEMARKRYRESYCECCSHHLATNTVMGPVKWPCNTRRIVDDALHPEEGE